MTYTEVLSELKSYSNKTIENIFENHGAHGRSWGVKVGDLKKIQKKIGKDHALSLQLFDSGISDAQYLAGLIADEKKISKKDLQHWLETAGWSMISEYTVPWLAADSGHGWDLGVKWIASKNEDIQTSGWATIASVVLITPDEQLDIAHLKKLLLQVKDGMAGAGNRLKYAMNSFVIAVGGSVKELCAEATRTGQVIGIVEVDMGKTACKVPYAPDYIQRIVGKGNLGKKKKMARC